MKQLLIVIDMQNDFIYGSLGTGEARAVLPYVKAKIEEYRKAGQDIVFTRDTHDSHYLETQEGKNLPVPHCIRGTDGWQIRPELDALRAKIAGYIEQDEDVLSYALFEQVALKFFEARKAKKYGIDATSADKALGVHSV